jgi:hypothetical protein
MIDNLDLFKMREEREEAEMVTAIKDYRDRMILDDVRQNDLAMHKDVLKGAKRYHFHNLEAARKFQGLAVMTALAHLGIPQYRPKINRLGNISWKVETQAAEAIDAAMKKHKVEVEWREKYRGEHFTRNGTYIYKNGELTCFISSVFMYDTGEKSSFAINREDQFFMLTNVRL